MEEIGVFNSFLIVFININMMDLFYFIFHFYTKYYRVVRIMEPVRKDVNKG